MIFRKLSLLTRSHFFKNLNYESKITWWRPQSMDNMFVATILALLALYNYIERICNLPVVRGRVKLSVIDGTFCHRRDA